MELAECERPSAISANGSLALLSGGFNCYSPFTGLVEIGSGTVVREWDFWLADAAFGPSGTLAEELVVLNNALEELIIEGVDGGEIGRMDVSDFFIFGPNFSSDGRWLAFGSQVGGGFVVDVEAVLNGASIEEAVAFNPLVPGGPTNLMRAEGTLAVTAHTDILRVWDMTTHSQWFDLPTGYGNLASADLSPDLRYLYYSGEGGVVRRMPLDSAELAAAADSRRRRTFTVDECERFLSDTDCSVYEET